MPPKTKENDAIQPLRDISAAQSAGGFNEAQPKDGKGTKAKPVEPPKRTINEEAEAKKWSDRFDIAKTYQTPMFEK